MRESTVTRLGEGVEASGRLGEAPQQRVFAALERYADQIRAHECEASAAVMTSAVRDAANGAEFAAAVRERFGLEGRTLSGDEEAAFTFAGATAARPAGDPTELVVIDIGGGSTELVCGSGGELGLPRLDPDRRRPPHRAPPGLRSAGAARSSPRSRRTSTRASRPPCPAHVRERTRAAVAVAGTATSCAAIDLALERYDTARVEGHVLSRATLDALLERLAGMPLERAQGGPRAASRPGAHDRRGRRRAQPGARRRSASARSRSPTATSSGASRWSSQADPEMGDSGRSYDGDELTPAGYSIRR